MKRDLYACNEENENKCANQVSGRCWVTLVNSRRPCGGKTRSPQRFPPWRFPTYLPLSLVGGGMRPELSRTGEVQELKQTPGTSAPASSVKAKTRIPFGENRV